VVASSSTGPARARACRGDGAPPRSHASSGDAAVDEEQLVVRRQRRPRGAAKS
jgi:hypothetical protein